MKLFTRYTRLNLWAMLIVFLIGASALFFTFRYILIRQVDEGLETEYDETLQYIRQYGRLIPPVSVSDQQIAYHETQKPQGAAFSTITLQGGHGDREVFRQYTFSVPFNGRYYQFFVSTSLEQTEYLLHAVALVTLITIVAMLLAIYLINRMLVKQLLQPFYQTIDAVRKHSLLNREPLRLPQTPIEEFTTLNQTLNDMAAKVQHDYQLMRNFTAQAAHELQTPLAVIRTRLEALMQVPRIDAEQAAGIAGVDDSVERLTRLFNSLLLLTKIENGQFPASEVIRLNELVAQKGKELNEMTAGWKLHITFDLQAAQVNCNKYLAETLISNLLNNAIRYNYPGGAVDVLLRQGQLVVANTSDLPALDGIAVFRPFYRHPDNTQDGSGLGLSIVKQICEASGFSIEYGFSAGVHTFSVLF
jgi:two-component system sensor histidine kinase QseC